MNSHTPTEVPIPQLLHSLESVISAAGYDVNSEHFKRTAARWLAAIGEFKRPDHTTAAEILSVEFQDSYAGMVVITDIEYESLCPHHLFPYNGLAAVGYIPEDKIVGISKLARLVEWHAHRIVTQEEATRNIVQDLMDYLKPKGAICVMTGTHTCMTCRGVKAGLSRTTTADLAGVFRSNEHGARDEFYSIVGSRH